MTYLGIALVTGVSGDPPGTLGGVGSLAGHCRTDLPGDGAGEGALPRALGPGTVRPALLQCELAAGQQESPRPPFQAVGVCTEGSTCCHNVQSNRYSKINYINIKTDWDWEKNIVQMLNISY